jgi:hypothetical protein
MRMLRKENAMRPYVRVSGLLFGLVALGHLLRAVRRWPLLIAGHPIPAVVSLIVCVLAGAMAFWSWRVLSRPEVAG